ncbi:hypothetical protein GCM10027589_46180 [Actinocorallia lasiicapitis]
METPEFLEKGVYPTPAMAVLSRKVTIRSLTEQALGWLVGLTPRRAPFYSNKQALG